MREITPTKYKDIKFKQDLTVVLDGNKLVLPLTFAFHYPVHKLSMANHNLWEKAARDTLTETLNTWLTGVFDHIVVG